MPGAPFSTVGGYGGNASLSLDPVTGLTAGQVDTQDGFPVLHPALTPGGLGLVANVVDPISISPFASYPELNAILCELRVIAALLREQMGDTRASYDLQTMRADEAWNTLSTPTVNAAGAL
jgi:hypothetical protein